MPIVELQLGSPGRIQQVIGLRRDTIAPPPLRRELVLVLVTSSPSRGLIERCV